MMYEKERAVQSESAIRGMLIIVFTLIVAFAAQATAFAATGVSLQWDANADAGVKGYKVYYQPDSSTQPFKGTGAANGASPVDVGSTTAANISGLDPSRPYYFAVTAYNADGVESPYSSIVSVQESVAPVVSVTAPSGNAQVSGAVTVSATATDNVGVSRVEFYINGVLQVTDSTAPYSYSWDSTAVADGSYTIVAKAYDAAGNVGQSAGITVTVKNQTTVPVPPASTGYGFWSASAVPAVADAGADNAVQLGVKFRADSDGYISGIRFYKGAGNTGTHVGSLWAADGTRLATATFTSESASGWQQVNFATPVAITANTVYVASYHTTVGHYSYNSDYFATSGADNGALHALASGVSGTNGVFAYGASTLFPNQSWKNSNYWVDVVYTPSATTPPVSTTSSIWSAATVPAVLDSGADNPVQLGVKFRSDTKGSITGIRFYKTAANTGTHVASLWSSNGKRLATATFTSESASGWQQVNFATPVAIAANTVYVASYHTTVGHYSYNSDYFTGKGADNGVLHALASGVSGTNGVYAYGASTSFPNQSYKNANYWVDVVFKP